MSGVGFWELVLLFLIGLIVLGPERLPRVANQLGSWLGQARRMTRVMKRQLEDELNFEKDFSIEPAKPARAPTPSVSTPRFVQEKKPEADDTHSPAHGAGDTGTGVGDDADYIEEPAPVAKTAPADPGETAPETPGEEAGKKESA
jgi:sec-independent protein translocase protein TatB